MKRLIKMNVALLLLFTSVASIPINFIERGNTYMANKNYTLAIEMFEQALEDKGIAENEITRTLANKQLALAHFKLKSYLKSELYLEQLMISGSQDPDIIFTYAQCQQVQKRYAKSAELYKLWGTLSHQEEEAKEFIAFCQNRALEDENAAFLVTPLATNTADYAEYSPYIHPDGYLVFTSDRPLSAASRTEVAGSYGANLYKTQNIDKGQNNTVNSINALNFGIYNQGVASYTSTGNTVFFTANIVKKQRIFSSKEPQYTLGIYTSDFDGFKWSKPALLKLFSAEVNCAYPSITKDGKILYFSSDIKIGKGGFDLYISQKDGSGWSSPTNLGSTINTAGNEVFPFVLETMKGKVLHFATDGRPGYGGLDIFRSEQAKDTFGGPRLVDAPINSSFDDFGLCESPGDGFGYFSSNRAGTDDVYFFSKLVTGSRLDSENKQPVEDKIAIDVKPQTTETNTEELKLIEPKVTTTQDGEVEIVVTEVIPSTTKGDSTETEVVIVSDEENVVASFDDVTSNDDQASYYNTSELSGFYIVFYSTKNLESLRNYRDKNYPDAIIIKGSEGFNKLCYRLSEDKDTADQLYRQESKKYKQSWIYKAGR
jgi:tetratricopeptide (TPR) repeat protein